MANKGKHLIENDYTPVTYDPQYILMVNHLKKYFPIKGGLLSQTLAEGVGLEEALKEKGDRFNSRGVWFQGAYPIRSGWNAKVAIMPAIAGSRTRS